MKVENLVGFGSSNLNVSNSYPQLQKSYLRASVVLIFYFDLEMKIAKSGKNVREAFLLPTKEMYKKVEDGIVNVNNEVHHFFKVLSKDSKIY